MWHNWQIWHQRFALQIFSLIILYLNIVLKATNRRFNCLHQKAPKLPFCCCWARLPPKRYLNRIKSLILSLVRLNYHHFVFESRKNFNRKYIFSFLLHLRWKRNTKCSLLLMHLTPCYFLTFPEAILRSAENAALIILEQSMSLISWLSQ